MQGVKKHNFGKFLISIVLVCVVFVILMPMTAWAASEVPGTAPLNQAISSAAASTSSLAPMVTERGKISLSIDGLGTNSSSGIIQVEKPAGATVRKAFMAAASTGFGGYTIPNGGVKIDGVGVIWSTVIPNSIACYNHWADVTGIVKSKIDAAPSGRINFTVTEDSTYKVDGEILAVIFDDPNQTTENTIVLFFGAQNVAGDTFAIGLAEPINLSNPKLKLDMSLGISYGFQTNFSGQYSTVDVNSVRMTSWAGGQDDYIGTNKNGALLTVGGLDDTNANPPDPNAKPAGNFRYDDELYNLIPFVHNGDTSINVFTQNPSTDDNIFFAALYISTAAVVGEGITLSPLKAGNIVGSNHTVTAAVQNNLENPIQGRLITFKVVSGPHAGKTGTGTTASNGQATFTYTGLSVGTDVIEASFVDSQENIRTSNQVTKNWYNLAKLQTIQYRHGTPAPGYSFNPPFFTSWMQVKAVNFGLGDAFNVTAVISASPPYVTVIDGVVSLGNIPAGGSAWSTDTFTIKLDTRVPQPPSDKIYWRIEYDDSYGNHQIINNVPQFP